MELLLEKNPLAASFQTHDLETFIYLLGFALLRSNTLHLLVANTLMDLVEIMKTTTVVIGNFTQSLQTKQSRNSTASLSALSYQDHLTNEKGWA